VETDLNHDAKSIRPPAATAAAFDLKGTVTSLTLLRLHAADLDRIERELNARIEKMPQLFHHAPVVIDFQEIAAGHRAFVPELVQLLRRCQLVPVAAANLPEELSAFAATLGLGSMVVNVGQTRPAPPVRTREEPAPREERAPPPSRTVTIRQPVRGGQVIHAPNADLVVLAPVNSGAQVIADGHIHVYGPLRGRALAGAQGQTDAHVFCQSLEAELVAVAGEYVLADQIPEACRGKPAMARLEDGRCNVVPL
jgi:septum site-determining protein MinC